MKLCDKIRSIFFIGFISFFCVGTCVNVFRSGIKDGFESTFKENILIRDEITEFHGLTQAIMKNKVIEDVLYGSLVKNDWGQLTDVPEKSELAGLKKDVAEMAAASEKYNAEFVYVQAPFKVLPSYEDTLPVGYRSYANENADELIKYLENENITCFDLRPVLESSPLYPSQIFYRTDHHWTIPAAFYSYGELTKYLNENYAYTDPDELEFLSNPNNFDQIEMKNSFWGTWGRRTGRFYVEPDDFIYYVPKFATDIDVVHKSDDDDFCLRSSFYYTMMTPDYVEKSSDGIKTNRYSLYLGGYTKEITAKNYMVTNDKKLLIFHDSFGFPLSAFMSLTFSETRILDLRNYKGDIDEYIADYAPDIVLAIYNPDY